MYEEQERKKKVEATAQLEPVRTAPPVDLDLVFREHHSTVFRTAYRITGNAGDAEDVLQTVFMRLLRRPPDAQAVGNMDSYLRRAAVNAALDLIRSRQAAQQVPLEDVAPLLSENASLAPDRVHRSAEIRHWLRGAVARLSPRAAEIFALRFFEGKDNPEIARALDTTPASIAVTLSRTRDRIQQEFLSYMGEIR
ncbi:MAG TPA: sigma-70 family RNA polymerase sigma factor [Bryobacteraceae bacterium]|nr:sigma-70 family RNA polymerase sigma factor [Bryobacteraceae bacterium]